MFDAFIGGLLGTLTAVGILLLFVRHWLEKGIKEVELEELELDNLKDED